MSFDMIGPILSLGLSAIGAAIGCAIPGMVSHGIMSRVDEGHGKFLALSAVPSSQLIYGFVLMLRLKAGVIAKTVSAMSCAFIGGAAGLAILFAAVYQGLCCASAIQAVAKQPAVFGKTFVSIGIIESFALFVMVFALLLI